MKENDRKMKKNEKLKKKKKWKKKKWKKRKYEKKMKKWKKMEKWKNEKKKNEKMEENDEKRKKNEKTWIHTQNPRRFPGFTVVVATFFRQNPRRFPWFCFGMCLFLEENQQPVLGGNRFSEEKWQFSLGVKQKHTFYRRKSTKKIAKVSPSNNNSYFRII